MSKRLDSIFSYMYTDKYFTHVSRLSQIESL